MKQPKITIKDAKRKGGKGYRVQSVAKNGEVLQSSQVLDTVANVKKNINAMLQVYRSEYNSIEDIYNVFDLTKDRTFWKKGIAELGIDNKKLI